MEGQQTWQWGRGNSAAFKYTTQPARLELLPGEGSWREESEKSEKKMFLRTTQTDEEQEKRQSRSGKGGEGAGGCGERKHVVLLKILQCGGEIWGLRGG